MRFDERARRGLMWVILGAGLVAVIWTIGATNPAFGYFLPGCLTMLWLVSILWWWSTRQTRAENARNTVAAHQREVAFRAAGLDRIDAMPGVEFEQYVAAVFGGLGYKVSLTKATGDFGVDIIATRNGVRTAVQCKRQATPVGGAAVQQVVAGAAMHQCTATIVVCNQSFTRAAQALAHAHGCRLIDRSELEALAVQTSKAARATMVVRPVPSAGSTDGPGKRGLLAAAGTTALIVVVCVIVGTTSTNSRRQEVAAAAAAAKVAPCPKSLSQALNIPGPLVVLPDLEGVNGEEVRLLLQRLGITEINWESANPDYKHVVNHNNWTVVSTSPRAGCQVGTSDRPTVRMTK